MKYAITFILFSLPLLAQTQYPECGNDYNCYYENLAKSINERREQQEAQLEAYRNQQLELQREELREVRQQNELLETQLQEVNERQTRLEEKQLKQESELRHQRDQTDRNQKKENVTKRKPAVNDSESVNSP